MEMISIPLPDMPLFSFEFNEDHFAMNLYQQPQQVQEEEEQYDPEFPYINDPQYHFECESDFFYEYQFISELEDNVLNSLVDVSLSEEVEEVKEVEVKEVKETKVEIILDEKEEEECETPIEYTNFIIQCLQCKRLQFVNKMHSLKFELKHHDTQINKYLKSIQLSRSKKLLDTIVSTTLFKNLYKRLTEFSIPEEVYFKTIQLFYLYTTNVKSFKFIESEEKDQELVLAACLFIASKIESDFCIDSHIAISCSPFILKKEERALGLCHKDKLLKCERHICEVLNWNLTKPTSYEFFLKYSQALGYKKETREFGINLLVEFSYNPGFFKFTDSVKAATTLTLIDASFYKMDYDQIATEWNKKKIVYTSHKLQDLTPCVVLMFRSKNQ
jgi:hypothetical protein